MWGVIIDEAQIFCHLCAEFLSDPCYVQIQLKCFISPEKKLMIRSEDTIRPSLAQASPIFCQRTLVIMLDRPHQVDSLHLRQPRPDWANLLELHFAKPLLMLTSLYINAWQKRKTRPKNVKLGLSWHLGTSVLITKTEKWFIALKLTKSSHR